MSGHNNNFVAYMCMYTDGKNVETYHIVSKYPYFVRFLTNKEQDFLMMVLCLGILYGFTHIG